jgi:hypothetical protein
MLSSGKFPGVWILYAYKIPTPGNYPEENIQQERTTLVLCCDPLKIRSSSTVDVSGVLFFSTCLWFDQVLFVALVMVVCFKALFFESRGSLIFPQHFPGITCSVLKSLSALVRVSVVFSDWGAKGSNRLGSSFLKKEAQPAFETKCFCVYVSVTRWVRSEKKRFYLCYKPSPKPFSVEIGWLAGEVSPRLDRFHQRLAEEYCHGNVRAENVRCLSVGILKLCEVCQINNTLL